MNRVLLTGASGFIGANLLRALIDNNYSTDIVIRKDSNLWRINDLIDNVGVHFCTLTERDVIRKIIKEVEPQLVFHLASYGGHHEQNEPNMALMTNTIGTANIVDACIDSGVDCFINAGSSSEYGIKSKPMDETDLLEPINEYGVSKASATLYCQAVGKKMGYKIITLRLFSPFGYYEDPQRLIPYMINTCLEKGTLMLSNPNTVRDFVFIEDVVDAFLTIPRKMSETCAGEILNLGSGKQHSILEVFNLIKEITKYEKVPIWGAVPGRESDTTIMWQAKMDKMENIFGWKAKHTLRDGLKKSAVWLNEHKNDRVLRKRGMTS